MFSKLFNSARSILLPTSRIPTNPSSEPPKTSAEATADTMVVTRRQSGHKAAIDAQSDEETSIVVQIPTSSSKKRRRLSKDEGTLQTRDEVISSPAVKRQKVLPMRKKEDKGSDTHSRITVEISVGKIRSEFVVQDTNSTSDLNDTEDNADVEQDTKADTIIVAENLESKSDSRKIPHTPKNSISTVRIKGNDPQNSADSTATAEKTSKGHKDISPRSGTKTTGISSSTLNLKHKRFGSQEPEVEDIIDSSKVEKHDLIESAEESSDDDAPEIVDARDALVHARLLSREAAKAVEEQKSAIRKKRRDKDTFLKQQAESANKNRKRAELIGKTAEAAELGHDDRQSELDENSDLGIAEGKFGQEAEAPTSVKLLSARASLPELLPAEYLEDDDIPTAEGSKVELISRKSKKTKFTDLIEKKPKDRRKGSTTYRVLNPGDTLLLAPKASHRARSIKDSWMQGRPVKGGETSRKPFSQGFFVKKR